MVRNEVSSWFIGTSVPCRISVRVNGALYNADDIPTITIYDGTGVKKTDAEIMVHEATGEYIYYAVTSSWPVGKCFYVISYSLNTIAIQNKSTFFLYDQETWLIIEKVRDLLDNLQEGELASVTVYEHYEKATRDITRVASATVDAALLTDAIHDQTALDCYVSYLTDRERVGDNIGTAAFIMLTELRAKADKSLFLAKQSTSGKGEVLKGVFSTTESSYQLTNFKSADPANFEATKGNQ